MLKIARFCLIAASLIGLAIPALAQPGPSPVGPGPQPPPSFWLYAAPLIYPPAGSCIVIPSTVTGGCVTGNSFNISGAYYVNGVPLEAISSVTAPLNFSAGVLSLNINSSLAISGGNLIINPANTNVFSLWQIIDRGSGTSEPAVGTGIAWAAYGSDAATIRDELTAFGATAIFDGRASLGTRASPGAVTSGTMLASFEGKGYDSSVWTGTGASLHIYAEGTWTPTSHPGEACLATAQMGATTSTDWLCVHDTGYIAINQNVTPIAAPAVAGLQMFLPDGVIGSYTINGYGVDGIFNFVLFDGTKASPTALVTGDEIGAILWKGYTGSASTSARVIINGNAAENWTPTANGTYLDIYTTAKTTAVAHDNFRFQGSGGLSVGLANITTDGGAGIVVATGFQATGASVLAATTVTGSFTATGLVTVADLTSPSVTVNGATCTLGSSCSPGAGAIAVGDSLTGGTPNGLLYNAANAIGNLATANNGVLVTSSGGVPSISSTLPSGIAATNMALTTPTFGVAVGTSLALGGATIGSNALAVTGTTLHSGNVLVAAHILATGTAPTISACGTGSPTISGGDNFGKVVAGTVATSCVINFGTTWGAAPSCNAASGTAIASLTVSATTTQLTIAGTALGGDTITWICGSTASLEPRDLPANDNWPPELSTKAA